MMGWYIYQPSDDVRILDPHAEAEAVAEAEAELADEPPDCNPPLYSSNTPDPDPVPAPPLLLLVLACTTLEG